MSIGLGLKAAELTDTEIVGTSGDRRTLNYGKKIGAFDDISGNLRSALRGARMVILDARFGETKDLLEAIGPILEEGCIVTDTGPSKVRMMAWAKEYLPGRVEFVGGRPATKTWMKSVEDASADAFQDAVYSIVAARSTSQSAVKTVVGLAEALGAKPLFLDEREHDSYAAAASHLPALLSSALVNAVSSSPGWREIAQVAGGEFGQVSALASDDPADAGAACLASADETVRWLDQAIEELTSYRDNIRDGNEDLGERLDRALDEWAKWTAGTVTPDDSPEMPTAGETISGMFFGRRISRRFRDMTRGRDSDDRKR